MFKHIKDGYYIVHNNEEQMLALRHYVKSNSFKLRFSRKKQDMINWVYTPMLICFKDGFNFDNKTQVFCFPLPLTYLKAALGICEHVWAANSAHDGYSPATLKCSKCGCNADHKLKATLGDECGI